MIESDSTGKVLLILCVDFYSTWKYFNVFQKEYNVALIAIMLFFHYSSLSDYWVGTTLFSIADLGIMFS